MSSLFRPVTGTFSIFCLSAKNTWECWPIIAQYSIYCLNRFIPNGWPGLTSPSLVVQVQNVSAWIKFDVYNNGLNDYVPTNKITQYLISSSDMQCGDIWYSTVWRACTMWTIYLSTHRSMQDMATRQWTCKYSSSTYCDNFYPFIAL